MHAFTLLDGDGNTGQSITRKRNNIREFLFNKAVFYLFSYLFVRQN